ncbi:MAG: hypothetical protein QME81_18455 [bacterium]|nr:hypothetical protein [bacterium]
MKRSRIFKVLLGVVLFGLGLNVGWALPTRVAAGTVLANNHQATTRVAATEEVDEATRQRVLSSYGKLPLYFIENRGQLDSQVRYYAKTPGQSIYFTSKLDSSKFSAFPRMDTL